MYGHGPSAFGGRNGSSGSSTCRVGRVRGVARRVTGAADRDPRRDVRGVYGTGPLFSSGLAAGSAGDGSRRGPSRGPRRAAGSAGTAPGEAPRGARAARRGRPGTAPGEAPRGARAARRGRPGTAPGGRLAGSGPRGGVGRRRQGTRRHGLILERRRRDPGCRARLDRDDRRRADEVRAHRTVAVSCSRRRPPGRSRSQQQRGRVAGVPRAQTASQRP